MLWYTPHFHDLKKNDSTLYLSEGVFCLFVFVENNKTYLLLYN